MVYAGVNTGGIYKSYDYGENWMPFNKGLQWPADIYVAALTINSKNGVIYLGVGGYGKGGIFKSTDDAESWQLLTRKIKFNVQSVEQSRGKGLIVIDPLNSQVIYAGSSKDGIFKTFDGGRRWKNKGLKGEHISSISIDYTNPNIIYVASTKRGDGHENAKGGIFKSENGGDSWRRTGGEIDEAYQLAMDPETPTILYAVCGKQGIFKTIDGGNTWLKKNKGLYGFIQSNITSLKTRFISFAIDQNNPKILYAGTGNTRGHVYKSVDGGDQWFKLTHKKNVFPDGWWLQEKNRPGGNQYSANCLTVDPSDSSIIYVAGRSGVWRSNDSGITWHPKVKGLEATVMNRIVVHPKQKDVFYIGNTDWVFFYSVDGGETIQRTLDGMGNWDIKKDFSTFKKYRMKNGRDFAIDPRRNPGTIYIGGDATSSVIRNSGTVFKSLDGGKNWLEANEGLPVAKVTALAIDPLNYDTLYAALWQKGVYKTINRGAKWEAANHGLPDPVSLFENYMNEILINPSNSKIIYILDKGNGIYKTVDGGKRWQVVSNGLPEIGFRRMNFYSGGISLDPLNPDTLYLGLYKHGIYKSEDGGSKWRKISPHYIIHGGAIDVDPQDGTVYVVSVPENGDEDIDNFPVGIYRSNNGGESWQAIHNDELLKISLRIRDIEVDPFYKGKLYLTTMGNGIIAGKPIMQ